MKQLKCWLVFLCAAFSLCLARPQKVAAATAPNVLLVYDSLNIRNNKQNNVAAMQRLLTSAGVTVHVESLSDYKAGGLRRGDYSGLVTMVNWDSVPLTNRGFEQEQRDFTGTQLHVGSNLTAAELTRLHASKRTLYRRELAVRLPGRSRQLLPVTASMEVPTNLPAGAQTYGQLQIQGGDGSSFPFAYRFGSSAFLPYFDGNGVSLLAAEHLVAQLFAPKLRSYRPLFTITGVTPYSNLHLLRTVAAYLQARGIPFAVSAATVAQNTDLPELGRYAAALRTVQDDGGFIFIRSPEVGAPGASSGNLLNSLMTTAVTSLSQKHVFPLGYSAPTYLQLDGVFKKSMLSGANTVLQLANPQQEAYARQTHTTQTYKRAYTYVSAASLNRDKFGRPLSAQNQNFALPTAVTFRMPDSPTALADFKRRVNDFNFDWADPTALNTKLTAATLVITHRDGQYFMNGRQQSSAYTAVAKPHASESLPSRVNDFFAIQSTFLWIFFFITITAMIVLLVLGRRIYVRMYRRK